MNSSIPYKIIGVDPGTKMCGYGILEVNKKKIRLIDSGVINLSKYKTHQEKLLHIYKQIRIEIKTYEPECMAVEAPFYGKNVQSMLKLGRAQGSAIVAGMSMGLEVFEYAPKKIKQSVTGNGNASKEQVAAMLGSILNISLEGKYSDATDALGAAVCHFYQSSSPLANLKGKSWGSFLKDNPDRVKQF